jgi:hypothetical protein
VDRPNFGSMEPSGFFQSSAPVDPVPDNAHSWNHLISGRHSNVGNNHQFQLAASYAVNDRMFFRKIAGGAATYNPTWNEVATRGANTLRRRADHQRLAGGHRPLHGHRDVDRQREPAGQRRPRRHRVHQRQAPRRVRRRDLHGRPVAAHRVERGRPRWRDVHAA